MRITKPSKTRLKRDGFKLVVEKRRYKGNVFVQAVDKGWFERHSGEYLSNPRVTKIYENENKVLIFIEV